MRALIQADCYANRSVQLTIVAITWIALLAQNGVPCRAAPGAADPDARMEQIEEQTESFANALLDLSVAVRAGDSSRIGAHFAEQVQGTPFPRQRGELRHETKWIHRGSWPLASEDRLLTHAEMVGSLCTFLNGFSQVEDARFKVKKSAVQPHDAQIDAGIALWLVARDAQGRREWVRGKARVSARQGPEGGWRITRFALSSLDSMVSVREIFSEVSQPAGLSASAPHFLERSDPGFAAYGAAVADVDGDGFVDICITAPQGNSLYLNQGNGTFVDRAEAVGAKFLRTTSVAPLFLDYDNDGDQDLFLSSIGEQVLLENRLKPDGKLVFWDISDSAGVARSAVGFSAVAGDVNQDGKPDIYVACYNRYGEILPDRWDGATNGNPNLLFVSQADGTFREVAAEWGVANTGWSYAAQFADIDTDGDLDLYVANDYGGGNALYVNSGKRFHDLAAKRGVVDHGYGMGVSFGDYDNDGDVDLHVTRMSSTAGRRILARFSNEELPHKGVLENLAAGNALYENLGQGSYREVSAEAGPFSGGWAWGGGFFDMDNDGWQDLYTPNGFISGKTLKDT
ncbi:MAG: VCBS repeat-containing protein [bacterium]|nr:VCBS repeat-containing protein [bacterium]